MGIHCLLVSLTRKICICCHISNCRDRIVVYSPQIVENYRLKSGEGLSVLFVVIWLLGDLCNLIGAVMAGLLPTVIILAIYVRFHS